MGNGNYGPYGSYEDYLAAINKAYIDRLRDQGARTTEGYNVAGQDYGYGQAEVKHGPYKSKAGQQWTPTGGTNLGSNQGATVGAPEAPAVTQPPKSTRILQRPKKGYPTSKEMLMREGMPIPTTINPTGSTTTSPWAALGLPYGGGGPKIPGTPSGKTQTREQMEEEETGNLPNVFGLPYGDISRSFPYESGLAPLGKSLDLNKLGGWNNLIQGGPILRGSGLYSSELSGPANAPMLTPSEGGGIGFNPVPLMNLVQEYFGTNPAYAEGLSSYSTPEQIAESERAMGIVHPLTAYMASRGDIPLSTQAMTRPFETKVTGGGANMTAPSLDWAYGPEPLANEVLFGYGTSGLPEQVNAGWMPVTPGFEFGGDPGIAGYHLAPPEEEAAQLLPGGGGGYLPPTQTTTETGGGGGGWGKYNLDNAPEWWKGRASGSSADRQFASVMNALIPFMSPEDQRTAASTLSRMFKQFESYNPLTNQGLTPPVPSEITDATKDPYESRQRAMQMLDAIQRMGKAGKIKTGTGQKVPAGVAWLQQIADVLQDFGIGGATENLTSAQVQQLRAALDPLLAEGKGSGSKVSQYAEIARMITEPFFSAGQLWPTSQGAGGQFVYGTPNRNIF